MAETKSVAAEPAAAAPAAKKKQAAPAPEGVRPLDRGERGARLPHDAQDLAREQLKINPVDSDLTDAVAERQVVSANGDGGVTHAHNLRHVTAG